MTLDDAAAILDITEKSVVRLILQNKIRAKRLWKGNGERVWNVNGADVRKRRRQMDKRELRRWV